MTKDYGRYFNRPSHKKARKRVSKETAHIDFDKHINIKNIGVGKHYLLQTYGCQGNEADSETMQGILEALGFKPTDKEEKADIIILNTCAIRENAENRVFGELGRLKQYKTTKPDLLLAVAGCMPQEESVVNRLLEKYPYVDLIFGTHNIYKLPEYIETALHGKERVVEVFSEEGQIVENMPKRRDHPAKAWVNIMFGCDEFCTYCVVPYTRGKERSRAMGDILAEVDSLIKEGYQEVTLLGQNVNAYGRDKADSNISFAALLEALGKTAINRVRFTTSHPNDFDQATIDVIAKYDNMMPHIHLPVQSGSDSVLKKMNRKYTKASYLALIEAIKANIPGVSITTDIIVGFPTETEADFLETLDLVEKVDFEGAFTFVFSPRANTPAAKYEDKISLSEKKSRLKRLNERINAGYKKGHDRFYQTTQYVLVDGLSKKSDKILAGYTPHNKLVNMPGEADLIGKIVPVNITEAKTWFLKGEIIGKP